jgi:dihydrofolate reductase
VGKIVITTNATLDGVVEDPDGKEGSDRGGWFYRFGEADVPSWDVLSTEQALAADALLLGRRTDTWFGTRERPGAWADRTLALPKYVVSTSGDAPAWSNGTVLTGDPVARVAELKAEVSGEILVYGSYTLLRTLIDHHLADELRLCVFPVLLGAGRRLFDGLAEAHPMRLTDLRRVGDGILFYTYEFERN